MLAFRSFCPLKKVTDFPLPWAAQRLCTSWCSIAGRRREITDQNLLTLSASLTNWSAIPVPFTPWWKTSLCKMHRVDFSPLTINFFQAIRQSNREEEVCLDNHLVVYLLENGVRTIFYLTAAKECINILENCGVFYSQENRFPFSFLHI